MKSIRRTIVKEWGRILAGLVVFAFGVHLTIYANIGLAPWDCLGMGIARHTPMNYGVSMTVMAVIIVGIDLLLGERIGWGTIIDALFTGNMIQLFNTVNPLPENHSLAAGILIMVTGFVFMAIGQKIYMQAGQCCGPRDGLLVGLGKRMPRISIGIVEVMLWTAVFLAGWALGGPVGIGTLLGAFGAGAVMNILYSVIGFEPRKIRHRDVMEITRLWAQAGEQAAVTDTDKAESEEDPDK